MWPWRRRTTRGEDPPAPSAAAPSGQSASAPPARPTPPAWQSLPPLQRTLAADTLTIGPDRVTDGLAAWGNPSYLAPLGHIVGTGEPAGVLHDLAVPVAAEPAPAPVAAPLPVAQPPTMQRRTTPAVRPLPVTVSRLTTAPPPPVTTLLAAVPTPSAGTDAYAGTGPAGTVAGPADEVTAGVEGGPGVADSEGAGSSGEAATVAPPVGERPLVVPETPADPPQPAALQRSTAPDQSPVPRRLGLGEPIALPSLPPATFPEAPPAPVISRAVGNPPAVPAGPSESAPNPGPEPGAHPSAGDLAGHPDPAPGAQSVGPAQTAPVAGDDADGHPDADGHLDAGGPPDDGSGVAALLGERITVSRLTEHTDTGTPADDHGEASSPPGDPAGALLPVATGGSSDPAAPAVVARLVGERSVPLLPRDAGDGFTPAPQQPSVQRIRWERPGPTGNSTPAEARTAQTGTSPQTAAWSSPASSGPGRTGTGTTAVQTWTGATWVPSRGAATQIPAAAVAQHVRIGAGGPAAGWDDGSPLPWRPTGATAAPLTLPTAPPVQRLAYSAPPGGPGASGFPGPSGVSGLLNAAGPTTTAAHRDIFGSAGAVVQRAPDVAEPGPGGDEPAATAQPGGVPGQATAPTGEGRTAAGGGPGGGAAKTPEPEELLKKLYDPLLRRLRTELRRDRERHGLRGGPG